MPQTPTSFAPRATDPRRPPPIDTFRDRDRDRDRGDRRPSAAETPRDRDRDRDDRRGDRQDAYRDRDKRWDSDRGDLRRDSVGRTGSVGGKTGSNVGSPAMASATLPPAGGGNSTTGAPAMEAALAYSKYMDAVKNHKKAQQERAKHSIHFKTFPAIMDRYEGDLKIAEAAVKEAERQWTAKKALHDAYMKEIISIETAKALASPKAVEPLTDMIKKLIIENVKSQPPQAPDQSLASQIAALREELRAMKRENAQKDATIDVLKSDVKGLTAKIGGIEKLKQDVIEAQELAVSLSGNNSASADSIKEAQERIQDLVDRVNKYQVEVADLGKLHTQMTTELKSEILHEQSDKFEKLKAQLFENQQSLVADMEAAMSAHAASISAQAPFDTSSLATVEDIMQAQKHILNIMEETDKLKDHEERIADLQQRIIEISNTPHGQPAQHSPASKDASITQINEKLQQLEQDIARINHVLRSSHEDNAQLRLEVRTSLQQVQNHVVGELARCTENLTTVERNLDARLVAVNAGAGEVKKTTEALQFAINHLNQRMEDWSSKDFYEQLVFHMAQQNPSFFGTGQRLDALTSTTKEHAAALQKLSLIRNELLRRIEACEVTVSSSAHQPNGANGPSPPTPAVILKTDEKVTKLNTEISALRESIDALRVSDLERAVDDLRGRFEQIRTEMKQWVEAADKLAELKHGMKVTSGIDTPDVGPSSEAPGAGGSTDSGATVTNAIGSAVTTGATPRLGAGRWRAVVAPRGNNDRGSESGNEEIRGAGND